VRASRRNSARGFTYLAVLVAVVAMGIVVEAAHVTTWRIVRADREAELLFRGQQYRNAVRSYYEANGVFPRTLEELARDPRSTSRRHIRALYADPLAKHGKGEWRLIRAPGGGIAGVASASSDQPLKRANFPVGLESFSGAKSYSEWLFEYKPPPAKSGIVRKPS
jgi:type II secretory pathway pseudopilin PulG